MNPWKNELNTLNSLKSLKSLNAELSSDRGRQSRVQCLALAILTAVGEPRRHREDTHCGLSVDSIDSIVSIDSWICSLSFRQRFDFSIFFSMLSTFIHIYPHLSSFIYIYLLCRSMSVFFSFSVVFSSLFLALEPRLDSGWNVGQVAQAKWRRFQGKFWEKGRDNKN